MQVATSPQKTPRNIQCEVVESAVVPSEYMVEIIHYADEGKISTVHFESHESKTLAEEYAAWKNLQA